MWFDPTAARQEVATRPIPRGIQSFSIYFSHTKVSLCYQTTKEMHTISSFTSCMHAISGFLLSFDLLAGGSPLMVFLVSWAAF
jgi:hypothetical protein